MGKGYKISKTAKVPGVYVQLHFGWGQQRRLSGMDAGGGPIWISGISRHGGAELPSRAAQVLLRSSGGHGAPPGRSGLGLQHIRRTSVRAWSREGLGLMCVIGIHPTSPLRPV